MVYGTTCNSTAATVWANWNSGWYGGSTANTDTWNAWNGQYYRTYYTTAADTSTRLVSSADNATIWASWNANQYLPLHGQLQQFFAETPEQVAARQRRSAEAAAEAAERQRQYARERKAAIMRARRLLLRELSPEQREQYQRDRYFDVLSADGQRRYRIKQGSHGNVELLNEAGVAVRRFCVAPTGGVPDEDAMLAQMLYLKTDEETLIKTANVTELRRVS